jgi:epoxyqueuosine reductase QueG
VVKDEASNNKMIKEIQYALELELKRKGADIIRFADLSSLSIKINRGFSKAILIGILLSKEYITNLCATIQTDFSEFSEKEHKADKLAEWTAEYLQEQGYNAFAQSEENIGQNGYFNTETKSSILPHKTIALLAGLGWIGKNNLLITQDYGCAICMCSVLTDAPIDVKMLPLINSKCGECDICKQICPTNAILGNVWSMNCNRDMLIDVFRCEGCLKCLLHCQWTVNYAKNK